MEVFRFANSSDLLPVWEYTEWNEQGLDEMWWSSEQALGPVGSSESIDCFDMSEAQAMELDLSSSFPEGDSVDGEEEEEVVVVWRETPNTTVFWEKELALLSRSEKQLLLGKLNTRSPVLDAFVYCACKGWGVFTISKEATQTKFLLFDVAFFMTACGAVCNKTNPTTSIANRVKTLRRYFPAITVDAFKYDEITELTTVGKSTTFKVNAALARMDKLIVKKTKRQRGQVGEEQGNVFE